MFTKVHHYSVSFFVSVAALFGCSASGENPGEHTDDFNNAPGSGGSTAASAGGAVSSSAGGFSSIAGSSSFGSGGQQLTGAGGSAPSGGSGSLGMGGSDLGMGGADEGMGGSDPVGMGGSDPVGMGGSDPVGMGGADDGSGGSTPSAGGSGSGSGGTSSGDCCSDCICRDAPPSSLPNNRNGRYRTATVRTSTGTTVYPTDAEPPFAAVAIVGGFTNTGPEMSGWGTFYASHGIVTAITTTGGLDFPDLRGRKLLAAVEELKRLNSGGSGPLAGKLAGRYGTSGYSMGGGGTTLATVSDKTLKSSVALAAYGPTGRGVETPTLFFCGDADLVAGCAASQTSYRAIAESVPKMGIVIPGAGHLVWFGPSNDNAGHALAFQKMFLEGDTRWKSVLLQKPPRNAEMVTNVK